MKNHLLFLAFVFSCSVCPAMELGNPAKFAARFDDKTGVLTEILWQGETLAFPPKPTDAVPQFFDLMQDKDWIFHKNPPKLVGLDKESNSVVNVTYQLGDWTVMFRYVVAESTLSWNAELIWNGKEPTKIRNFWMAYPIFSFGPDAEFFIPAQYPPKKFTPDNFPEGTRQGSGKNSAPLVFQLDKKKSVILLSDNLIDYADRPSSGIERRDGGVRLTQSFDVKGHVKPGLQGRQILGVGYLKFVDGDGETALLNIHDLLRKIGHVVPKDRPKWFESAILYSFHPGGTIGSQCKDLGGFVPATKLLDRIKEIDCNAIWLMPLEDKSIYWPRDYYKFQDGLGSTPEKAAEEYKALVNRAHELGLKVLQDNVPHGGSNTNDRAKAHPEWLVQEEDGSTLDYWCFDFNWPSWIDYMADVSRYYVKEYDIDGYRVDACGGSKIPNWNEKIPYSRASHSQSQGGFNMLRAVRKAVKDQKPDGAILAEVNGSIYGAVSDAVYDFDLCYSVLHDARKFSADEFVKRLRRWLHEQQYSDLPDLLRLRHVESHDSLRGQLWYGTEPHRAMVALTAFIHGIPLVYHEQEIGNLFEFQQIFRTRAALPELNGGDADYLSVEAPSGVFAVLRTKGNDASVAVINFNDVAVNGKISVPIKNKEFHVSLNPFDFQVKKIQGTGDGAVLDKRAGDGAVLDKRAGGEAVLDKRAGDGAVLDKRAGGEAVLDKRAGGEAVPQKRAGDGAVPRAVPGQPRKPTQDSLSITVGTTTAFIDPETGLLNRLERDGKPLLGNADLLIPNGFKNSSAKPTVTKTENSLLVNRRFGDAVLEIEYSKVSLPIGPNGSLTEEPLIRVRARWKGENVPKNSAISFSVPGAKQWLVVSSEGILADAFRPNHLTTDGVFGSIYWRPQGTNVFYDSLLVPLYNRKARNPFQSAYFKLTNEADLFVDFPEREPSRFRLLDRLGEKQELVMLLDLSDVETVVDLGYNSRTPPVVNKSLRPTAGGWVYENDHYRLRLSRSGTITSLIDKKIERELVRLGDLYTDYGYSDKKMRYAAADDVEAGCRIVQDGDRLRLRFEGQLRHNGRFDLLRPPVEYFIEYALDNGSEFNLACGVKTARMPTDNKGFLAAIFPMERVESFEYFCGEKSVASGTNVNAKGRSPEYRLNEVNGVVLRASDQSTLLQFSNIDGDAATLFLDRKNFFVTFDDRDTVGPPNRWRSFIATVSLKEPGAKPVLRRSSRVHSEPTDIFNTIFDGGFENSFGNDLISLRTGAVLKGNRKESGGWQTPQNGSISVAEHRSGNASAHIVGEIGNYRLFAQDIDTKNFPVGTKLKLTAWIKGENIVKGSEDWQIGCIRFAARIDGKTQYYSSPNLLGTFDWKQTAAEFTVPEKLERFAVQVGLNGASGTLWIDDVEIFVEK